MWLVEYFDAEDAIDLSRFFRDSFKCIEKPVSHFEMLERRIVRSIGEIVVPKISECLTQVTIERVIQSPQRRVFQEASLLRPFGANPIRHSATTEGFTEKVLMEIDNDQKSFTRKLLNIIEKITEILFIIFWSDRIAGWLEHTGDCPRPSEGRSRSPPRTRAAVVRSARNASDPRARGGSE